MSAEGGAPGSIPIYRSYTAPVSRSAKPSKGPRPRQGAHLLALRKTAGLTQIELAKFLDVPQANIAFWEWSDKPPRSDLLPNMAKALGVSVEDLIVGTRADAALAKRPGPMGEVQRAFEEVRSLPRKQQRKVVEFVFAFVNEYKRKAG